MPSAPADEKARKSVAQKLNECWSWRDQGCGDGPNSSARGYSPLPHNFFFLVPSLSSIMSDQTLKSRLVDTSAAEDHTARRKMRKGTRSCIECRPSPLPSHM